MATVSVKKKVCDFCGRETDVVQRRVSYVEDSTTRSVDVCADHRNIGLEEIREKFPKGKRGRPSGQRVASMSEVKASRTRKSPAAKRGSSTRKRT